MSTNGALATQTTQPEAFELALVSGDLSKLSVEQRLSYYQQTCASLGLNSLSRPFEYITLNGKLTFYARRDCTDQLRSLRKVSVEITGREVTEGVYVVTARATMPDGRKDESVGAVTISGLKGDALCNAFMKAETKAKRRVTLSICGLGIIDESEVETVAGAVRVDAGPVSTEERIAESVDVIAQLKKAIADAKDSDELAAVAERIQKQPAGVAAPLRPVYAARKKALS